MSDTKAWYQSQTIWAAVVGMLAALLGPYALKYGVNLSDPATQETIVGAIVAVSGVFAIIGRVRATTTIGTPTPTPAPTKGT